MRTYACDKCGAEFTLENDDFDDTCPECFSDLTTLIDETPDDDL